MALPLLQERAAPARRHLALYLPRWATDWLRRAEPTLAAGRPLALYEKHTNAMRLAVLDEVAARAGLFAGQSLSDARALCPGLVAREIDRAATAQGFLALAEWHAYASPIVGILKDDAEWGDLVIDVTGAAHLFGGETALLALSLDRLEALGIAACGAVAPGIGAAWALAHFSPGGVLAAEEVEAALAPLPVAALRLDAETAAGLRQMGLKRIGQLTGRDRGALKARFGTMLLTRLDQALGRIGERVTPLRPVPGHHVEQRFADPIGLIDQVLMVARDLAFPLAARLEAEGLGARGFELCAFRVDHQVMRLTVGAARATRDPAHIARLFAHRAERLEGDFDAGFGIEAIRLGAYELSTLAPRQPGLVAGGEGTEALEKLCDRLVSRLGPGTVLRSAFADTHIPERAVRLLPVGAVMPAVAPSSGGPPAGSERPLRLLPRPEQIEVIAAEAPDGPPARMRWRRVEHRLVRAAGPERIGAEWWREKAVPTRDYFRVEDEDGRRFWIFREGLFGEADTSRWYLHGLFA